MPPTNLENSSVNATETPKLQTPESEAEFLRTEASKKVEEAKNEGQVIAPEQAVSQVVREYAKSEPAVVLHEARIIANPEYEKIVTSIDTLPHQEKMRELYNVLLERGILNTLKILSSTNSPHLEEDFHHVIVQYVHTGKLVPGLDKERALEAELKRRVFEIRVPLAREAGKVAPKQVRAQMERFLSSVFAQGSSKDAVYSFEIACANFATDITFYAAVPDTEIDLFAKQFLGNFPAGQVTEIAEDYNLFNEFGFSMIAEARHEKRFAYALSDSGDLESLAPILAAFNQVQKEGEGVAVQLIVRPDDRGLLGKTREAIGKIRAGASLSEATDIPLSFTGDAFKFVGSLFGSEKKEGEVTPQEREKREREVRVIEEKISAPFVRVDLRLVVSAADQFRAQQLLDGLMASYGQFSNRETSGGLKFQVTKSGSALAEKFHAYTFREQSDDALVLNHKELASLFHPPLAITVSEAPNVAEIKASTAPPPADLPREGTLLGYSTHRGERHEIRMSKQDRLRHFYVIGQTGTGKTSILKNMIIEEIKAGHGVCFIDPHGSDVQDILGNIPPERLDDIIYIDPTYTARPFGLNMLEFDVTKPEQKIFVVNELLAIFKRLYASSPESMGPAFEQYFRNATMLVMESPELGNTMIDIMRVLVDANYREEKLKACKNPIVTQFWRDMATKTTGDAGLQNMAPYIINKFDVFISNDVIRPIIAQETSSFNFRDIMDSKKIFLVNLAKGKLGEMNANLIGLIIIGKFLLAAMSRVDSFGTNLPDFYLYIDEFQNVTTPSISAILSEARKYGLSLNLAHQYLEQLPEDIKGAVFGNVGSMAIFRVGDKDAGFFGEMLKPTFTENDVTKIQNYNAYMKVLINGKPVAPFSIVTAPPARGNPEIVEKLKQVSYMRYGRDRAEVDKVILERYAQTSAAAQKKPAPSTPPAAAVPAQSASPRPSFGHGQSQIQQQMQQQMQPQQAVRPQMAPQFPPQYQQQYPQAAQYPQGYPQQYSPQQPMQYPPQMTPQFPQPMTPQFPPPFQQQYPQYAAPQYGYPQPQGYPHPQGYAQPVYAQPYPQQGYPQQHAAPAMQAPQQTTSASSQSPLQSAIAALAQSQAQSMHPQSQQQQVMQTNAYREQI